MAQEPTPIAIVDFEYVDTSGEVRDQTAEHSRRLQELMLAIRNDLARTGRYGVIPLPCRAAPCTIDNSNPSELLGDARRAGARLLLFGGIHKKSTLVQWARAQVVDVQANKVVYDRLFTFRGDNDEAWQRAESFIVRDLQAQELIK